MQHATKNLPLGPKISLKFTERVMAGDKLELCVAALRD